MREKTINLILSTIITPLTILAYAAMVTIAIATALIILPFALYAELRDWEGYKKRRELWRKLKLGKLN